MLVLFRYAIGMNTNATLPELIAFLLPPAADLRLDALEVDTLDPTILLFVTSTQPTASCPRCQQPATRVHSHYTRTLADVPWASVAVRLYLQVRRWFCPTPGCVRRIFTERLPALVMPFARRTTRLADRQRRIGLAVGGNPGARIGATVASPTSRDTLLRLVRAVPDLDPPHPQVIGVDDWAFRKGHHYGTLIVDLERHRPLDLLPDRTADTFAAWLKQYPTIRIVSRDRASSYADGAAEGAPDALQVADRWHLLRNLGEALQRVLAHHPTALRSAAQTGEASQPAPAPASTTGGTEQLPATPPAAPEVDPQPEPARTHREQQFHAVLELHAQGWRYRQIAAELQLDRRTVRRYILGGELPKRGAPGIQRTSSIQPYRAYVEQRWQAGCQNGMELWRELQAKGYSGSYSSMCRALKWLRQGDGRRTDRTTPVTPKAPTLSPRQAMWLLVRPTQDLTDDEQVARDTLCAASGAIALASKLAQSFQQMVTTRDAPALDGWLAEAKACEVPELRQFAASLQRDYAAVKAGLSEEWSNGQLEGQVNRLKLLKRQMFGRAKFDLLRTRVLHAA